MNIKDIEQRLLALEQLFHADTRMETLESRVEELEGVGAEENEINGDGTAGRVLRKSKLIIKDGTAINTINCELTSEWNGNNDGPTDDIGKGATVGNYSLNATGEELTIEVGAIAGMVAILNADIYYNASGTGVLVQYEGAGRSLVFRNITTGANVDLTALVDIGDIYLHILYLTSA